MNHSGDAAEQIVRLSLEGAEVAARIVGTGAKELAILLLAALKDDGKNTKTKGKTRLESMLKSGKELKVFAIKESNLKKFTVEARRYGIPYCVIRHKKGSHDGLCDIMVKAEDAQRINRIVERFDFATVDMASVKNEVEKDKSENETTLQTPEAVVQEPQIKDETDKLLNELLPKEAELPTKSEGKPPKTSELKDKQTAQPQTRNATQNPDKATTEQSRPSEPISDGKNNLEGTVTNKKHSNSVREELKSIAADKKKEEKAQNRDEKLTDNKQKSEQSQPNQHVQPQNNRKSKKLKER